MISDLPAGDEHASDENGHIEWMRHCERLVGNGMVQAHYTRCHPGR